jgi:uncharacterized protein YqiB (DUF1249 family)
MLAKLPNEPLMCTKKKKRINKFLLYWAKYPKPPA